MAIIRILAGLPLHFLKFSQYEDLEHQPYLPNGKPSSLAGLELAEGNPGEQDSGDQGWCINMYWLMEQENGKLLSAATQCACSVVCLLMSFLIIF